MSFAGADGDASTAQRTATPTHTSDRSGHTATISVVAPSGDAKTPGAAMRPGTAGSSQTTTAPSEDSVPNAAP